MIFFSIPCLCSHTSDWSQRTGGFPCPSPQCFTAVSLCHLTDLNQHGLNNLGQGQKGLLQPKSVVASIISAASSPEWFCSWVNVRYCLVCFRQSTESKTKGSAWLSTVTGEPAHTVWRNEARRCCFTQQTAAQTHPVPVQISSPCSGLGTHGSGLQVKALNLPRRAVSMTSAVTANSPRAAAPSQCVRFFYLPCNVRRKNGRSFVGHNQEKAFSRKCDYQNSPYAKPAVFTADMHITRSKGSMDTPNAVYKHIMGLLTDTRSCCNAKSTLHNWKIDTRILFIFIKWSGSVVLQLFCACLFTPLAQCPLSGLAIFFIVSRADVIYTWPFINSLLVNALVQGWSYQID